MKNKQTILIACVNYNTYDKLEDFIHSIEKAFLFANKVIEITLLIGDNSDSFKPLERKGYKDITLIHTDNNGNLGYIGGITKSLEISNIKIENFDYFTISNVDLKLAENFFLELINIEINNNIACLAPAIISEKEQRDRNPKILNRPSAKKMKLTMFMYQFPILHILYEKFIYKYKTKKIQKNNKAGIIYAGHGSFMIFTKEFCKQNRLIKFPSFLFGEEIFFAELIRKSNLKTLYMPKLIIHDFDHANTSDIKANLYYKMNYSSIKILIKKFF